MHDIRYAFVKKSRPPGVQVHHVLFEHLLRLHHEESAQQTLERALCLARTVRKRSTLRKMFKAVGHNKWKKVHTIVFHSNTHWYRNKYMAKCLTDTEMAFAFLPTKFQLERSTLHIGPPTSLL